MGTRILGEKHFGCMQRCRDELQHPGYFCSWSHKGDGNQGIQCASSDPQVNCHATSEQLLISSKYVEYCQSWRENGEHEGESVCEAEESRDRCSSVDLILEFQDFSFQTINVPSKSAMIILWGLLSFPEFLRAGLPSVAEFLRSS
mmetsp:Transcript_36125/g.78056  ORF Transcript_36125/g.78056 Transcript_36125/m.78056 type:complete len:145 (+) Transcript_36125:325-759(+)